MPTQNYSLDQLKEIAKEMDIILIKVNREKSRNKSNKEIKC